MDIGPYNCGESVVKSDTADFVTYKTRGMCDALYVGGAGIVVAFMEDLTELQFTCVAGQVLPVAMRRVKSATTTATLMIALWRV